MISVIICSASEEDLVRVKESIIHTIGVEHEIIAIDNSQSGKGICTIYNEGTRLAKFPILCFMHEDIEFVSQDWGREVINLFMDERIGLVGVAGGGYKSLVPSSWYNYHLQQNGGFYCNVIQGFKHTGGADQHDYRNPRNETQSCVACVDGCWFCTRKEVAIRFPFDEKLLHKFHGYDIDFSIAVSQAYKTVVTYKVLFRHFSEGNFNKTWMDEIIKVHKKWSRILPVNVDNLPEDQLKRIEIEAYEGFLDRHFRMGYSKMELSGLVWAARRSRITTFSFVYKLLVRIWKMKAD
jgi:hypothetical protein